MRVFTRSLPKPEEHPSPPSGSHPINGNELYIFTQKDLLFFASLTTKKILSLDQMVLNQGQCYPRPRYPTTHLDIFGCHHQGKGDMLPLASKQVGARATADAAGQHLLCNALASTPSKEESCRPKCRYQCHIAKLALHCLAHLQPKLFLYLPRRQRPEKVKPES